MPVQANPRTRVAEVATAEPEASKQNNANNEVDDGVGAGPTFRTLKYLGPEVDYESFATSPPLLFKGRVCEVVPESVAVFLIMNSRKKNGLPVFKDITKGAKKIVHPETEDLPTGADGDDDLFNE